MKTETIGDITITCACGAVVPLIDSAQGQCRTCFNTEFESDRHILDADSPGARREAFMHSICVTACGALHGHDWRPVGQWPFKPGETTCRHCGAFMNSEGQIS